MAKKVLTRIVNSKTYIYKPEPNPGGAAKDFFYGKDDEFREHKSNLVRATSLIAEEVGNRTLQNFATVKVRLKDEALAKSHRPTKSLFNRHFPVVGGGELGEIYVQVNSKSLPKLAKRISQAREVSELQVTRTGKIEPKVSKLRSEIGAIDSFDIFNGSDKSDINDRNLIQLILTEKRDLIVEIFSPKQSETLTLEEILELKSKFESTFVYFYPKVRYLPESRYFHDGLVTISPQGSSEDELYSIIKFLREHPIVKKFYPSPVINYSEAYTSKSNQAKAFPFKELGEKYPKVILVDKGIRSNLLGHWVTERQESLGDEQIYDYHADEMASLLVGSKYLNNSEIFEKDGCEIFDIWIPSSVDSFDDHFDTLSEFTDWLYLEVQAARQLGYRIISMSTNFQGLSNESEYSFLASRIDHISYTLDVLFVISAGYLNNNQYRPEWPKKNADVFKMLARHKYNDKILQPADSVSSISVGAINHVTSSSIIKGAPTRYTRRGPSTAYGIKPDVVHVGGIGDELNSYILTMDGENNILSTSQGTSLSTPLIAKTLATLDLKTNNSLSISTLKGMLIHNAEVPNCMKSKELFKETREFVGFGFPPNSEHIISKDENSFSFVFENKLKQGQIAEFDFQWPNSLVNEKSGCKGQVKMTLVYKPPIDLNFGDEYIRANVDASLQQKNITKTGEKFGKQVFSIWDKKLGESDGFEEHLISHGFKWWPCKVYERISKSGFGNSRDWRLRVKPQVRDGYSYPEEGIEFSIIITITSLDSSNHNIYNEMRNSFRSIGVEVEDITISDQVRI